MHYIMEAQNRFMELPAKVRKEFDNDPGAFLAFLENPNNYDRAIELGLIERQPAPPNPQRDTPTNVPAADAAAQQAASDQSST
jgi:phage internal scaffolding protein